MAVVSPSSQSFSRSVSFRTIQNNRHAQSLPSLESTLRPGEPAKKNPKPRWALGPGWRPRAELVGSCSSPYLNSLSTSSPYIQAEQTLLQAEREGTAASFAASSRSRKVLASSGARLLRSMDSVVYTSPLEKKSWIARLAVDGSLLADAPKDLRDEETAVGPAVASFGCALQAASERLRATVDIVQIAVQQDAQATQYAADDIKCDKELVMEFVSKDGHALEHVAEALCNDAEVALCAVTQVGGALAWATKERRSDDTVVLAAVQNDGMALRFASASLRASKAIGMAAVACNGSALEYVSDKLLCDADVVRQALDSLGPNTDFDAFLRDSPQRFRDKRPLILGVVSRCGRALAHASDSLRNDQFVALVAMANDGSALALLDSELRGNRELVLTAVAERGSALEFASERMVNTKDVVLTAVANDGLALAFASDNMRDDDYVVLCAVTNDGFALEFASSRLRGCEEIVLCAAKSFHKATQFATSELRDNQLSMAALVEDDVRTFFHASRRLKGLNNVKPWILQLVSRNGLALQFASNQLRANREVALAAVGNDKQALDFVSGPLAQESVIRKAATSSRVGKPHITLSVRSRLLERSLRASAEVHLAMLRCKEFKQFHIVDPNLASRSFCGSADLRAFADPDQGCLGDCGSICSWGSRCKKQCRGSSETSHTCWRFSYRKRLGCSRRSGGCLVQVRDWSEEDEDFSCSDGQAMELRLAEVEKVKAFVIELGPGNTQVNAIIMRLSNAIQAWMEEGRTDESLTYLEFGK